LLLLNIYADLSPLKKGPFITLMMEAARTSETLVNFYQTTRRCNPEDSHLRKHRRENLKSSFNIFHTLYLKQVLATDPKFAYFVFKTGACDRPKVCVLHLLAYAEILKAWQSWRSFL
jgi:hypothetical protein